MYILNFIPSLTLANFQRENPLLNRRKLLVTQTTLHEMWKSVYIRRNHVRSKDVEKTCYARVFAYIYICYKWNFLEQRKTEIITGWNAEIERVVCVQLSLSSCHVPRNKNWFVVRLIWFAIVSEKPSTTIRRYFTKNGTIRWSWGYLSGEISCGHNTCGYLWILCLILWRDIFIFLFLL